MTTTRRGFLTARKRPPAPVAIADTCLARQFVHCQSCADACPEQAIRFTPRLGGPPLPAIDAARCTACGECVAACPVDALSVTSGPANA